MKFNSEKRIPWATAIVAVCALIVSFWQLTQNHKHNKLSVKPLLNVDYHVDDVVDDDDKKTKTRKKITFVLKNVGVGPAIITDFLLLYDGKKVTEPHKKFFEKKFSDETAGNVKFLDHIFFNPNSAIPVKASYTLLSFEHDEKHDISFLDKLNLYIIFESIYKEKDEFAYNYDPRT